MKTIKSTFLALIFLTGISEILSAQNVGQIAPNFTFQDLEGTQVSLSDFNGKVVFLFLLGYNCPYCLAVGPNTESEIQEVYGENPEFIALGLDLWDGSNAQVMNFKSQTGISYTLLVQAGNMSSLYNTTYDRALVIDKNGILRFKGTSGVSNDLNNATNAIDQWLDEDDATGIYDPRENPRFYLGKIVPNPVRSQAHLNFVLQEGNHTSIQIFNAHGQEVLTPFDAYRDRGNHEITFNLSVLKNGLYFYTIRSGSFLDTKKLVVER